MERLTNHQETYNLSDKILNTAGNLAVGLMTAGFTGKGLYVMYDLINNSQSTYHSGDVVGNLLVGSVLGTLLYGLYKTSNDVPETADVPYEEVELKLLEERIKHKP